MAIDSTLLASYHPVLEGVRSAAFNGSAQYAFSTRGTLVYASGGSSELKRRLALADRTGAIRMLPADPAQFSYLRLSPDETRLALTIVEPRGLNVHVFDLERGTMSRLTFNGTSNWGPIWSPDGQWIAFSSLKQGTRRNIYWTRSDGAGQPEQLTTGENLQEPRSFSPDGKLMIYREQSSETGFDLWVEVTGSSVLVVEGVASSPFAGQYSVSRSGLLAYLPGRVTGMFGWDLTTLVWVDRDGREELLVAEPRPYAAPRVSPDGTRLTVVIADPNSLDVWMVDAMRGTTTRFTFDPSNDWMAIWTPDGLRVIFDSFRGGEGGLNLFSKPADGTGQAERLTVSSNRQHPFTSTPDGRTLIFEEDRVSETGWDLIELSLDGEAAPRALLDTVSNERAPAIAPDGEWIAYQSDELGQYEIFVRPYPDVATGQRQVSTDGGRWPVWGPDSRELFYMSAEGMMAASIETKPIFRIDTRELLFENTGYAFQNPDYPSFDVSPDGKRFLMLKSIDTTDASKRTQIHVVLNWFEELERLAPRER